MLGIFILFAMVTISTQYCYEKIYKSTVDCTQRYYNGNCATEHHVDFYELDCYFSDGNFESNHSTEVHKLRIYSSNMTDLNPGFLAKFNNLESILMMGNSINRFQTGVFDNLPMLESLNLTNNYIHNFPNLFSVISNVQSIDLSVNNITLIEANTLVWMKNLQKLILSNNRISDSSFLSSYCEKLNILDLSHNRIESFGFPVNCTSLKYLYVSYNNMTDFHLDTPTSAPLLTLDLSWNKLNYLDSDVFKYFGALEELNIGHNALFQINDMPVNLFRNNIFLKKMNLSSLGLKSIIVGTFTKLQNLQILDLSSNNLTSLPKGIFHDLESLETLYLNENRLTFLDHIGADALKNIQLNDNLWNCDTLADVIHKLKSKNIQIVRGNSSDVSNIYGINCFASDENQKKVLASNSFSNNKINDFQKEYILFLNQLQSDIEHILLQEDNFNQSKLFWRNLKLDYQNFSQELREDIEQTLLHITNTFSTTNNTSQMVQNNSEKLLHQWILFQKNSSEIYRKNMEDEQEQISQCIEKIHNVLEYILNIFTSSNSMSDFADRGSATSAGYKTDLNENISLNKDYKAIVVGLYCILIVLIIGFTFLIFGLQKRHTAFKSNNEESNPLSTMQV